MNKNIYNIFDIAKLLSRKDIPFTFPYTVYSLQTLGIIIEQLSLFLPKSIGKNNIFGFFFNFAYLSVVKYGFTCSIDFQISVEIFLFMFFVHFSIGLFTFFIDSHKLCVYILNKNSLQVLYVANIYFSSSVTCLLTLFTDALVIW